MIDSFIRSYQGKLLKEKKTHLEWTSFLKAKALQGCQLQIKVIVYKNIKVKKFDIITFSMPHCIFNSNHNIN